MNCDTSCSLDVTRGSLLEAWRTFLQETEAGANQVSEVVKFEESCLHLHSEQTMATAKHSQASSSPELRFDRIQDRWVIISPVRGKRPTDFKSSSFSATHSKRTGPCAFCLHHEHECAPEIFRIPEGTSSSHWKVRVIENLYPALSKKESDHACFEDMLQTMPGYGFHEVVIDTPDHSMTLSSMDTCDIQLVLVAYKRRLQQLFNMEKIQYVQIFKNHGETAGASMAHSHSQIIALPIVPKTAEQRLNIAKEYFAKTGECNLCSYINTQISSKCLLIKESSHFILFAPFAASYPFELWIAPRSHSSNYQDIKEDEEAMDLACMLKHTLQKLDCQFENPPYNLMIHSSPRKHLFGSKFCHWFLQIVPQLTRSGGFEMATGCYINPIYPESSASIFCDH